MSVIVNRKIRDNEWSHLSDDEPLAVEDVTVSLDRCIRDHESFGTRRGRVGVRLRPGDALEDLVPFVDGLELIALEFDRFTEGRGYSQAYLLRKRHGYTGELRAINARRDHVMYMERCGINAFEPAPQETVGSLLAGFDEITERYQPSHDRVPLIFRQRARHAHENVQETSK